MDDQLVGELVSICVAAAVLEISIATVRRRIKDGELEAVNVRSQYAHRPNYKVKTDSIRKLMGVEDNASK